VSVRVLDGEIPVDLASPPDQRGPRLGGPAI
jgi:hypothetical protein